MTIMFISDLLDRIGGSEQNLCHLATKLKGRGHNIIIVCLRGGDVSRSLSDEGFLVYSLDIKRIYSLAGLKATVRLARVIRQQHVDVILTYHDGSDFLGCVLGAITRVPIVSTRRDMGYSLKPRHIWAYRLLNRFFTHIVSVSGTVKRQVVESQWADPSDISVIYNGVEFENGRDAAEQPPSISGGHIPDDHIVIGCLANIREVKGQTYLVRALASVVCDFPRIRLLLIGAYGVDTLYYQELQRLIGDLDLKEKVIFVGSVGASDIPSLLRYLDIGVLPSLSEGLSNTLLEYMAARLPVVATLVGGNPEVVLDGETGLLVAAMRPEALAEALLRLIRDPDLRSRMGELGYERIERAFSATAMVDRYEDVLRSVVLSRQTSTLFPIYQVEAVLSRTRQGVKCVVASVVCRTLILRLFLWLKRMLCLGKLQILCFHEVSDLSSKEDRLGSMFSSNLFARQLAYLKDRYDIVELESCVSNLIGKRLGKDILALTFDDCYKGLISSVLPQCRRLGIPFAVFLNTGAIDFGIPQPYDLLRHLLRHTWRRVVDLSSVGYGTYLLHDPQTVMQAVKSISANLALEDAPTLLKRSKWLCDYFDVPFDSEEFRNAVLTWDDVRELRANGATIGAHSVTHRLLSSLSSEECIAEVSVSKRRLEEELGEKISLFAYPFGHRSSYSCSTIDAVSANGFRFAFTLEPRQRCASRYTIGRTNMSPGVAAWPSGAFCPALLAVELSGLGDLLFGRCFKRMFCRSNL